LSISNSYAILVLRFMFEKDIILLTVEKDIYPFIADLLFLWGYLFAPGRFFCFKQSFNYVHQL